MHRPRTVSPQTCSLVLGFRVFQTRDLHAPALGPPPLLVNPSWRFQMADWVTLKNSTLQKINERREREKTHMVPTGSPMDLRE